MSLILGGRGGDILGSSTIQELFAELDRMITEQASYLMPEPHLALLDGITNGFRDERVWEEQFLNSLEQALEALTASADVAELELQYTNCLRLGGEFFLRRQSVLALHAFCTESRDRLIRWAVSALEARIGPPPTEYACCGIGYCGRSEATLSTSCNLLLIYRNDGPEGNAWFTALGEDISNLLDRLGVIGPGGMKPLGPARVSSIDAWQKRIASLAATPGSFGEIARICDLRLMAGAADLAEELFSAANETLRRDHTGLQGALRTVSTMPVGFNFFGRLKLEKRGGHRGEFNLIQSTLTPLVLTARILAIRAGISATSTPDRIRLLLDAGELGVTQTTKLLRAYHDFITIKVQLEITGKGGERFGFYFEPDEITHDQELSLRQGLDALFNLQRIVYQSVEA